MDFTLIKYKCRKRIKSRLYTGFLINISQLFICVCGGFLSGYIYNKRSDVTVIVNILLTFLIIFVSAIIQQGGEMWHYRLMNGKQSDEGALMYCILKQAKIKTVFLNLKINLSKLFYTILLTLPGNSLLVTALTVYRKTQSIGVLLTVILISASVTLVIGLIFSACINQRYFIAKYLLIKNKDLTVKEAVKQSITMMNGKCLKVLLFKMSFIPHFFMCILIIPIVYVLPYYRQSCVSLKRIISGSFYEEMVSG